MAHNQNHLLQQLMLQQQMMGNQGQPSNMNTTGVLNPNLLTMPGILSNPFGPGRRGQTGLAVRKPPISEMLMRMGAAGLQAAPKGGPAQLGAMFGAYGQTMDAERDRAIDELRARQTAQSLGLSAANLKKQQKGEVYVDTRNNQYREVFDPMSGRSTFQNVETGEVVNQLPPGTMRATDAALSFMSKNDYEAESAFRDEVTAVPGKLAILQRYIDAGFDQAGPELYKQAGRALTRATGIEFGFDLDKLTEVDQIRSRLVLELARELLKGQGQITEGERAIAAGANADPERTTPETFQKLVDIMYAREKRKIEFFRYYQKRKKEEPNLMFRDAQTEFALQLADQMPEQIRKPFSLDN